MENKRILVVDDHPVSLKLVSSVLESHGYEVYQAADAEVAQVIIATSPPDMMLIDIALPGMGGLTLARLLKADPDSRHIIIVALTTRAMQGDDKKAYEAGCDGYITKPIDLRTLTNRVYGYMNARDSAKSIEQ